MVIAYIEYFKCFIFIQGVLEVGDVIDEVLGMETRRVNTQMVVHMLKQNRGAPITMGIVKVSGALRLWCVYRNEVR